MLNIVNIKYEDIFYKNLGSQLKSFREKQNITQKEIATALGISFQQYQKYEAGINRIPFSRLVKICNIYKIDLLSYYANVNLFAKQNKSKLITENN